jgi:hypothetical protein
MSDQPNVIVLALKQAYAEGNAVPKREPGRWRTVSVPPVGQLYLSGWRRASVSSFLLDSL